MIMSVLRATKALRAELMAARKKGKAQSKGDVVMTPVGKDRVQGAAVSVSLC